MKIVLQKDGNGQDVPGRYLVVVPSLFGDAVLFGPASLAECEQFILAKMQELSASLTAQIKEERARLAPEPKRERSSGMGHGR